MFNYFNRSSSINKMATISMAVFACALIPSMAFAADSAGDLATNLFEQLAPFADLLMAVMFLVGIGIGALSALKFKAHNENPQQSKITTPIVLLLVAAALIGLPAYLSMAKQTLLKDGDANSLNTGSYDNIGG